MVGLNLEGSNKIFEQPKSVDAVPEASVIPTVEGVEQSSTEPSKDVEAHDQEKGPKMTIDDSEAAGEPRTEVHPTDKVESFTPTHAEEQGTPSGVCSFHEL